GLPESVRRRSFFGPSFPGAKGALVFTIPIQAVKDNRTGGADTEVVVVANPANWREPGVTAGQELVGQAPAGAEDEERRPLAGGGREGAEAHGRGAAPSLAGGGGAGNGRAAVALGDGGDGGGEVGDHGEQVDGLAAEVVLLGALVALPMRGDARGELALRGDGVDDEEALEAEGAARARDVVQVEVGERGGHDLLVLVVDRVMHEGDRQETHGSSPSRRARSSSPSASVANRSGRRARVRKSDSRRRQRRMRSWLPLVSASGTATPRKLAGRVYCGCSSRPASNDSSSGESALPRTPGRRRATASTTTMAASSPPVRT